MVMGIVAEKNGFDVKGTKVTVKAEVTSTPVNRISSFTVTFALPRKFSEEDMAKLRNSAGLCHIHNSLHPDVAINVVMSSAE